MDGDVGDVQDAGAEVVEAGGGADGELRPLCGKVGTGVAVDGDDFVLRAEGGVFCTAAVEDVGQGGVVAVLFALRPGRGFIHRAVGRGRGRERAGAAVAQGP